MTVVPAEGRSRVPLGAGRPRAYRVAWRLLMLMVAGERRGAGRFATGRRAFTTLFDQAVSSVSNFAVTAVVAHATGPAGLGAFSIAYAAWLVVAAMHRSLVTDQMIIEGDAQQRGDVEGLASGLGASCFSGWEEEYAWLAAGCSL